MRSGGKLGDQAATDRLTPGGRHLADAPEMVQLGRIEVTSAEVAAGRVIEGQAPDRNGSSCGLRARSRVAEVRIRPAADAPHDGTADSLVPPPTWAASIVSEFPIFSGS